MNPSAENWQNSFHHAAELAEIATSAEEKVLTVALPERLISALRRLNKNEIYDEHKGFHIEKRYEDPELDWIIKGILQYLDLLHDEKTTVHVSTKQDLLDEVYGFVKRSLNIKKNLHPHVYKRSLFCHANIRNYSEEDFKLKFWRKYLGVAIYIRIGVILSLAL
ncbi:hypothetical protein V8B55DRAFT_1435483 [Mucor lusitanicus]|uniref:Uncharacterized protein n=1 Tax=Mucor lusitanicus CBS 277.49 TaxID=747725 RepID=A0A168GJ56_MUCCL|nr:hypothetical protein MUCCIDRAFT_116223 [Mucor lusitanicus CBS 277.49]